MNEFPPIDPSAREGYGPERSRLNYSIGEWIVDTAELAEEGRHGDEFKARKNLLHILDNLGFLAARLVLANPELDAEIRRAVATHPNHEIHEHYLLREFDADLEELREKRARAESDGRITFDDGQ